MKVKKVRLVYVSFHRMNIDGSKSGTFAIGCPDVDSAMSCASDVSSVVGIRYVRINFTGRFPNGVTYIPYEEYLDKSFLTPKE